MNFENRNLDVPISDYFTLYIGDFLEGGTKKTLAPHFQGHLHIIGLNFWWYTLTCHSPTNGSTSFHVLLKYTHLDPILYLVCGCVTYAFEIYFINQKHYVIK